MRTGVVSMPTNITSQNIQIGTPFPAWRLPNGINKASDGDLERSTSSCERWAIASGLLVVLGLIVEAVVAFIHPSYDSPVETWAPFIADTLVALGVAGEVLFTMMSSRRHSELLIRSNAKLTDAIMRAGEATKKASMAEARASIANQKAQEAILELEKFRAERILTGQQMARIAEKLKQFAGTEYDMALHSNDPELMGFLYFIETTLLKGGWKALSWLAPAMVITWRSIHVAVGISVTNIVVGMHREQASLLLPAAQCLAEELMAAGINARVSPMPDAHGMSQNTTAIHILIGRKS
jgi:hypothetical protein